MNQQFDPFQNFSLEGGVFTGQGNAGLPVSGSDGYPICIREHEVREARSGAGSLVAFKCEIMDGPYKGSFGEWRENIGHENETTKRIAEEKVRGIARVIGIRTPSLSNGFRDLYNKPMRVVVDYSKGEAPGQPGAKGYTEVIKLTDLEGRDAGDPQAGLAGGQSQQQQQVPQQIAGLPQQQMPGQNQVQPQQQQMPQEQQFQQTAQFQQQQQQMPAEQLQAIQNGVNSAPMQSQLPQQTINSDPTGPSTNNPTRPSFLPPQ